MIIEQGYPVRAYACFAAALLLAGFTVCAAFGQSGTPGTLSYQAAAAAAAAGNSAQNPFLGSVPPAKPTAQTLELSLKNAIERSLKYNLGVLLSEQSTAAARAQRWQALSKLLPSLNADVSETRQQINLEALGFPANKFAGFPVIVGPFNTFDARAALSAPVLNFEALRNHRAARDSVAAAQYTYDDARNTVVLAAGNAYLRADAGKTRVSTAEAEVQTAQALYQQAVDRLHAGLSPEIDVLRAGVELKSRQQQLIAAQNDLATAKLDLARVAGIPMGQSFQLTTPTRYTPFTGVTLDKALEDAYNNRSDYKAALASVHAAEEKRRAVLAERYPSVNFNGNFGDIGLSPGNSHETFAVAGTVKIPIFEGGRIHGELLQANANLKQAQEQADNLREQIAYDVRTALLNLKTAADQVTVATSNVSLAQRTLDQARDRFAAGVTDNIEVVEAQEALAAANESYITSLYQDNLAKVALARAAGVAETAVLQYLGGK